MKEQVIERDREIARLKHELAKQADGSLFNLKQNSADDIAGHCRQELAKGCRHIELAAP